MEKNRMTKPGQIAVRFFLSSFLFLLALLTNPVTGVTGEEEFFKLPMPTEFIPAVHKDGSPQYITAEQIEMNLRQHSREFQKLYWNREIKHFILPSHDWMIELLAAYNTFLDQVKVKAKAEVWDCENYSSFLNSFATVRIWKAGYYDTRGAIGWMRVDAQNEWAGLPPMMHALVFAVTEKGLFVAEPQNGQYIKLEDYPNKQFIQEVFLF
jgi:hypothetical protein